MSCMSISEEKVLYVVCPVTLSVPLYFAKDERDEDQHEAKDVCKETFAAEKSVRGERHQL